MLSSFVGGVKNYSKLTCWIFTSLIMTDNMWLKAHGERFKESRKIILASEILRSAQNDKRAVLSTLNNTKDPVEIFRFTQND
jgi:hypothetical protein